MKIGQNCFVLYLNNGAIAPSVLAYLNPSSAPVVGPYSLQLNMMCKRYWVQSCLISDPQKTLYPDPLTWTVLVFPSTQGQYLLWDKIPIPAPDPLRQPELAILTFDTDAQQFGLDIGSYQAVHQVGYAIEPRVLDFGLYGVDFNVPIATFSNLQASAYLGTGAVSDAGFVDFTLDPLATPEFPTLSGVPWLPTAEGSNVKQTDIGLGAGSISFLMSA